MDFVDEMDSVDEMDDVDEAPRRAGGAVEQEREEEQEGEAPRRAGAGHGRTASIGLGATRGDRPWARAGGKRRWRR